MQSINPSAAKSNLEQSDNSMPKIKPERINSKDHKIATLPLEMHNGISSKGVLDFLLKSCTKISLPKINEDGDLIATCSATENQRVNFVVEDQKYSGLIYLAWNCIRLNPSQIIAQDAVSARIPSREIPLCANCENSFDQDRLERYSGKVSLRGEMALGLGVESFDEREYDDVMQILDSGGNQYDINQCQDLSYTVNFQASSICPVKLNMVELGGLNVSNIKQSRNILVFDRSDYNNDIDYSDITGKCSSQLEQQQIVHHCTSKFDSSNQLDQGEENEEEMEEITEENAYINVVL